MTVCLILLEGVQDIHAERVQMIFILQETPQVMASINPPLVIGQNVVHVSAGRFLLQQPEAMPLKILPAGIVPVLPNNLHVIFLRKLAQVGCLSIHGNLIRVLIPGIHSELQPAAFSA